MRLLFDEQLSDALPALPDDISPSSLHVRALGRPANRRLRSDGRTTTIGTMPVTLTPRERSHLKARAHALEPVVFVGHSGLTDTFAAEIDRSLVAHELIKVRVEAPDRHARAELCAAIGARADAAEVQRVGKILVLWRPKPDEPATN
jgi:RNA-binding protein